MRKAGEAIDVAGDIAEATLPTRPAAARTYGRWAAVLLPGVVIAFVPLLGLSAVQRHLLGVFVATIVALVARPVPMGVSVILASAILGITGTVGVNDLFTGFANPTVWLVFTAFLIGRAVSLTHFGARVAYFIIARFGRSPLTLGY